MSRMPLDYFLSLQKALGYKSKKICLGALTCSCSLGVGDRGLLRLLPLVLACLFLARHHCSHECLVTPHSGAGGKWEEKEIWNKEGEQEE